MKSGIALRYFKIKQIPIFSIRATRRCTGMVVMCLYFKGDDLSNVIFYIISIYLPS